MNRVIVGFLSSTPHWVSHSGQGRRKRRAAGSLDGEKVPEAG